MIGRALALMYGVGRLAEGAKYWSDYRKNTGYTPRYPLRSMSRDIAPVFMMTRAAKKPVRPVRYVNNHYYYRRR